MRRFSSYGPIDTDEHYYASRKELIDRAYRQLMGENPQKGGRYITVWAPRQRGKTWLMLQVLKRLEQSPSIAAVHLSLEHLKSVTELPRVIASIGKEIARELHQEIPAVDTVEKFQEMLTSQVLKKPLILILDEFDALSEESIDSLVSVFRNIYIHRQKESSKPAEQRWYRLHGVALIGVRSVLGIENVKGSPFNVQHSLHIPNLTYDEVAGMFRWYEKESGQEIEPAVIRRLYNETNGQPGLTCWLGELLTETYNQEPGRAIKMEKFEEVQAAAIKILPNNNILNIISKVNREPYKQMVLELFKTDRKVEFTYDNTLLNYLYMNGVIDHEKESRTEYTVRFSCPFVQKRLFNFFSSEFFPEMGKLYEPFESLDDVVREGHLDIRSLVRRYQTYLKKNRDWLLRDAPRRTDLRIYEAVYHFSLYSYLDDFLDDLGGRVFPEFPTGNGKIDLIILHGEQMYGLELKSYTNEQNYKKALARAAQYGKQLGLTEIFLVLFVEYIDEARRQQYEQDYRESETGVTVKPVFLETGT